MSKTYKHQLKFKTHQYWVNFWEPWGQRNKRLWEPPFWINQVFEDRSRDWYRKQSWRKFRHQWKHYLKHGGKEPHNRPENFDWNLW